MALPFIYLLSVMNMAYYHPEDYGHVNIYISGYQDTTLEYLLPWEPISRQINLDGSNDRRWSATYKLTREQATKPIRVASSHQVSIQVSRGKLQMTNLAAYTAFPLTPDGRKFILSSQPNSPRGLRGAKPIFVVGAGDMGASIRVYDYHAGSDRQLLFTRFVSPNSLLEIPSDEQDITGLCVRSNRPIAVYSGHQCGNVPTGVPYCEPLYQQVPPFSLVGKQYIMGPIMHRALAGYTARVITTETGTDVVLATTGGSLALNKTNTGGCSLSDVGDAYNLQCRSPLRTGSYVDLHVTPSTAPLVVKCSAPCYAYQMNHGGSMPDPGVNSDPFMALIAPLGEQTTSASFSTITSFSGGKLLIYRNFVNVIAPKNKRVLLDGELLIPEAAYIVGDFRVYYKEIRHGFHSVTSQDGGVINLAVQVYGHGPGDGFRGSSGYGFTGGNIGRTETIDPIPSTTTTQLYTSTVNNGWIIESGPRGETGPSTAISTGIVAAIVVIAVILVCAAVVVTVVVLVIRRKRKARGRHLMDVSSTNTSNTYMNASNSNPPYVISKCQVCPDKSILAAVVPPPPSVPLYDDIHPTDPPPLYEDMYASVDPVDDNAANEKSAKSLDVPVDPPIYHVIKADDVMVDYEVVDDVTTNGVNVYEDLAKIEQKESSYDTLGNSQP